MRSSDVRSSATKSSALRAPGEALLELRDPQVAVAAHDLGEQLLLGAEVVVQQPARDAGLARDVVERRAGDAALRDATSRIASTIRAAFSPASAFSEVVVAPTARS